MIDLIMHSTHVSQYRSVITREFSRFLSWQVLIRSYSVGFLVLQIAILSKLPSLKICFIYLLTILCNPNIITTVTLWDLSIEVSIVVVKYTLKLLLLRWSSILSLIRDDLWLDVYSRTLLHITLMIYHYFMVYLFFLTVWLRTCDSTNTEDLVLHWDLW
jgi:hypothetical protein